jgi:hypothetical protein
MKIAIILFVSSLSLSAFAGGMISIQGELLQKCSETNCQVKVGSQLYVLDFKRLSSSQRKLLKTKNAGDTIEETVAMAAVTDVKDIKK